MRNKVFTLIELPAARKRGFTLIELLVVVAIIALLVTILMPMLDQAKALAKQSVCLSHKHTVGLAAALYASEHEGAVPSAPSWTWEGGDRQQRPWYWFHLSENFDTLGNAEIAKCPEDPVEEMQGEYGYCGAYEPHLNTLARPGRDRQCWKELYGEAAIPQWCDGAKKGKLTLLLQHDAERPQEILFIACTASDWGGTFRGSHKFGRFHAGKQKAVWLAHPGGTAGLFVDGHSEPLDEVELLDCRNGGYPEDDDYGIYEYWDHDKIPTWR